MQRLSLFIDLYEIGVYVRQELGDYGGGIAKVSQIKDYLLGVTERIVYGMLFNGISLETLTTGWGVPTDVLRAVDDEVWYAIKLQADAYPILSSPTLRHFSFDIDYFNSDSCVIRCDKICEDGDFDKLKAELLVSEFLGDEIKEEIRDGSAYYPERIRRLVGE